MKILFWAPVFLPDIGGIQLVSMRLIQNLIRRGHEFVVITTHGRVSAPDYSENYGFPVHRFPIVSALQDRNLKKIIGIEREIRAIKDNFAPEVEHVHFGGPAPISYMVLRTANASPAPIILSLHTSVLGMDGSATSITGQIFRKSTWIAGVSSSVLEEARQILPNIQNRSSVIYNGIQNTAIEPTPILDNEAKILCMGRLSHEKGFAVAINAFARIVRSFPHARLIIAGDGPERSILEQQVKECQIGHAVQFMGAYSHDDVFRLVNQAMVVVVPSRCREAFPQVALEASQMARPVIASKIGGLAEIVLDGETGILVDPENSDAITQAVTWLLENPEAAVAMGQKGRQRAHTLFSEEKFLDQFESLYFQCKRNAHDDQSIEH